MSCERWDYFVSNEIVHVAELRQRKDLRKQASYAEEYIRGHLWFEIVFQSVVHDEMIRVWLVEKCPDKRVPRHQPKINGLKNFRDNPVFINSDQFAQDSQTFEFRPVTSVVWLKEFNVGSGLIAEPTNAVATQPFEVAFRRRSTSQSKWEVDMFRLPIRDRRSGVPRMPDGKRPRHVVKSRSKVGDDISNNEAPLVTHHRINGDGVDTRALDGLQIALSREGDLWLARPAPHGPFEIADVHVRPLSLQLGAMKWMADWIGNRHDAADSTCNAIMDR